MKTKTSKMTREQAINWLSRNRKVIKLSAFEKLLKIPANTMHRMLSGKQEMPQEAVDILSKTIDQQKVRLANSLDIFLIHARKLYSLSKVEADLNLIPFSLKKERKLNPEYVQPLTDYFTTLLGS